MPTSGTTRSSAWHCAGRSSYSASPPSCAGAVAYFLHSRSAVAVVKETTLSSVQLREVQPVEPPYVPFTDITQSAGIRFRQENGANGHKLLPETMGGGCAFFDFDGDGDQDLLFVNSLRHWPWDQPAANDGQATTALYRNDGTGKFDDVTAGSGLDVAIYGMGVAVGDYDNDGRVRRVSLGGRTGSPVPQRGRRQVSRRHAAGARWRRRNDWSTSCGWFDYDNDGDLDLFVCNYVEWSREYDEAQNFQLVGGGRAYGRPQNFEGTFPYLYRNEGDGRFTEVAEAGRPARPQRRDARRRRQVAGCDFLRRRFRRLDRHCRGQRHGAELSVPQRT